MTDTSVLDPDGEPVEIVPRSYNDGRLIGEALREKRVVVIDLRSLDEAAARRLIDFAAGAVFVLHARIERIVDEVFLITHGEFDSSGLRHRFDT